MAMIALLAVVLVILIALALSYLGVADSKYIRKLEYLRKRGAAVWWIGLSILFVATGVFGLQVLGFLILLYIAIVAVGVYDVDYSQIKRDARQTWRRVRR